MLAGLLAVTLVILVITLLVMARASKGYDRAKQRRAESGQSVQCSTCHSWMVFAGIQDISTGASSAGLGAGPGEDLPVEVYRCPTCRKIEMFLPPSAG